MYVIRGIFRIYGKNVKCSTIDYEVVSKKCPDKTLFGYGNMFHDIINGIQALLRAECHFCGKAIGLLIDDFCKVISLLLGVTGTLWGVCVY